MTLDELIAREEIRDCILRHFRAADRCDADLDRRAFWDDARFVGGPVEGAMKDVIPQLFGELLPAAFDGTCHYASNILVTVAGDEARAECYAVALHALATEAATAVLGADTLAQVSAADGRYELLAGVRYAIELERRGGEWRMLKMQPIIDWARAVVATQKLEEIAFVQGIAGRGRRDRSDPAYFGDDWRP